MLKATLITIALVGASLISPSSIASEEPILKQFKPTDEMLERGKKGFSQYCSSCHGKTGEGHEGPSLHGNKVITGPIAHHIHLIISGRSHTQMPSWGLTELSDQLLGDIITYTRNSWGNDDLDKYGDQAGGIATPDMVHHYRDTLEKKAVRKNIRM